MQFNHPMRAVVLDDNFEEATVLIKAFASIGVPAAHYTPEYLEDMESETANRPFGVRLLGLDLDLIGTGTIDIKHAIGCITRLLRPVKENGPFGLIIWSTYPDDVKAVTLALDEYCGDHRPNFKAYISKVDVKSDPNKLNECIITEIERDPSLHDLLAWESSADRAASEAVREIANLASGEELFAILTALARGAVGKDCDVPEQRLRGVFEALAQIHSDILEQVSVDVVSDVIDGSIKITDNTRAQLNLRLLTATARNKTSPGSVYLIDDWKPQSCPFPPCGDLYDHWVKDFSECFSKKSDAFGRPVLLEVTASCDYAQKKSYGQQLITGLLLPSTTKVKGQFLKQVGPILYDGIPCMLIFNSRVILWNSIDEESMPAPILRLRHAPLEDIRTWLAGMSARGGVISV